MTFICTFHLINKHKYLLRYLTVLSFIIPAIALEESILLFFQDQINVGNVPAHILMRNEKQTLERQSQEVNTHEDHIFN